MLDQLHYLAVLVDNDDTGSNMDLESMVNFQADVVADYHLLRTVVEVDNSMDKEDMVGKADMVDTHPVTMLLQ